MSTKNSVNINANTTKRLTEPVARARTLNTRTSRRGFSCRSSISTNRIRAAIPMTSPLKVRALVHPRSGPSWMPRTSPPIASAEVTEPSMSKRPSVVSCERGTNMMVSANARPASARGTVNIHGQLVLSMIAADANNPIMPPVPAKPAQMPMARARSDCGKLVVITDRVTGMIIAAPAPATIRNAIRISGLLTNADSALAAINTVSPATSTILRPHRSPIAPIGISSAARVSV